jgi:hypothetical protein
LDGRSTDFLKVESGVKSIGGRVRRVAIDLANDNMVGCPAGFLE